MATVRNGLCGGGRARALGRAEGGLFPTAALMVALMALISPAVARAECKIDRYGELPVTMANDRPVIPVKVNGKEVNFFADTGAFFSMLSRPGARRLKLRVGPAPYGFSIRGVGGAAEVSVAQVDRLEMAAMILDKVDFMVGEDDLAPDTVGLIGQNLLSFADAEFDLGNGAIRLFQSRGCGNSAFAYWAAGKPYSIVAISTTTALSPHFYAAATLNGRSLRVMFDTGAPRSILTLRAAARAGVTPQSAGAVSSGVTSGIGPRVIDTWVAPFDSFKIGDEEVRHARLRIGAVDLGDADMLLGADFFLSHRIYVSKEQRKLYFTYNGGRIFDLDSTPGPVTIAKGPAPPAPVSAASATAVAAADGSDPTTADGWRRRAAAFAARNDLPAALADYGRAIALAPTDARNFYDRGMLRMQAKEPAAALADLDQALKLKPDHQKAHLARGALRLAAKDEAGATADFEAASSSPDADADLPLAIAAAYSAADHPHGALAFYDRWLAAAKPRDPGRAAVLNGRCWERTIWGQELDRARADCDEAIRLKPGVSGYLDSRGLVRLRQGDLDGSIADYDAALRAQPKQAWSLYGRGLAKLKKGATAEGKADMAAALALQPGVADAARRAGLVP